MPTGNLQEVVARNVQFARTQAKLRQQDLATRLGLSSHSAIADLEAGRRRISATDLAKLADVLGKPLDWFFDPNAPARDLIVLARAQGKSESLKRAISEAWSYYANYLLLKRLLRDSPQAPKGEHGDPSRL